MRGERIALVAHVADRRQLGQARPHAPDDASDSGGRPRRRPLEGGDLLDLGYGAQSGRRVEQHRRRLAHRCRVPGEVAQRVDQQRRGEEARQRAGPLVGHQVLPADHADRLPAAQPGRAQHVGQARRGVARLARQAERLAEHDIQRQRQHGGIARPLVADEQHAAIARAQEQDTLLEARVVASQVGQVGVVLAVAVDDQPVAGGGGIGAGTPRGVERSRQLGPFLDRAEVGQGHLAPGDLHRFTPLFLYMM